MGIRMIREEGDPLLRKVSREVQSIDDRTKTLLEDMKDTLYHADGLGLAAPQVGVLRRVVVIDMREGEGLLQIINPKIIDKSPEIQVNQEACLSVPEHSGFVERPMSVTVEYMNENEEYITKTFEGYSAVCISHEIDHLDGILYIDKEVDPPEGFEEEIEKEEY